MKRPPFDDPGAFRRRWSHLSPDQLHAESRRDPLLFAADHLPLDDRYEGTVLVVADIDGASAPVLVVIPDGPPEPAEEDCLGFLAKVIARLDDAVADASGMEDDDPYADRDDGWLDDPDPSSSTSVRRLGIVIHRLGSPVVNDLDRRWMRALGLVSVALGIETIGVISRPGCIAGLLGAKQSVNDYYVISFKQG